MLKFFRLPFATTGDKTAVPDAVDSNGNVSYSQGYGFDYQRQKTDPAAKNIERDKMNQILFDITTAIAEIQSKGGADFITSALNGGTAYSYGQNAIVNYGGAWYISLVAANTALPTDATKWALLPTPALLQQAAFMSANAGGTVNAITAAFTPAIAALPAAPGTLSVFVRAAGANLTTTPTFKADALAAKNIVKGNNLPLQAGDIAGAGHWLELQYDATLDKWVLQNPAKGVAQSLPVGLPLMWPSSVCPSWALTRDGSAISRASYAALFSVLCPTRNGTTTSGSAAVTGLSSTTDLYIGMPVEGTGIPAGTTIATITSASAITLSANATASGTVPITLFYFGYGSGGSSTTFGVPDDRGLFERGLDTGGRAYDVTNYQVNITSGSATVTGLSSTKDLFVGMSVTQMAGTGLPAGATIASIPSATSIVLSANCTVTGQTLLRFVGNKINGERADSFMYHGHDILNFGASNTTSGSGLAAAAGGNGNSMNLTDWATPKGGAETRPRNRAYLPIIVY